MEDLGGAAPRKREKKGAGSADATGKGDNEGSAPRAAAPEMLTPLVRTLPLMGNSPPPHYVDAAGT